MSEVMHLIDGAVFVVGLTLLLAWLVAALEARFPVR